MDPFFRYRIANPDNTKNVQIETINIPQNGKTVHLKGYGFVKVFRIASKEGDKKYWATNEIEMDEPKWTNRNGRNRYTNPGKLKRIIVE